MFSNNMNKFYCFILIFFASTILLNAQISNSQLDSLDQQFESFQYIRVITTADSLLKLNVGFTEKQLIKIYRVKGISEYSLQEEINSRNSFRAILNIDSTYQLDSAKTSPKIISFFKSVKEKYLDDLAIRKRLNAEQEAFRNSHLIPKATPVEILRTTMIRSLILPGLGHIHMGEKSKGIILASLSAVSLGSMVYFIIDANNKENDYLAEKDPNLMGALYSDFENSRKIRNISLISFAVLWLYSQIDILFFTDFNQKTELYSEKLPRFNFDSFRGVQLSYNFAF